MFFLNIPFGLYHMVHMIWTFGSKLCLVYTLQYLGNDQWENTWKRDGHLILARDSGRVSQIIAIICGAQTAGQTGSHCPSQGTGISIEVV